MRTRIALATTSFMLAACSEGGESPAPPDERDASGLSIEIGTGEVAFEPVQDGAPAPLIAGAQGGFHVWVSVRAFGFAGPHLDSTITTELLSEDGGTLSTPRTSMLRLRFDAAPDGALEFVGWPGVLDTTACPVNRLVRVRVTLSEEGLSKSSDTRMQVDGSDAFRLPLSCLVPADGGA